MKSEQLTCRQPSELDAHSKKLDISTEAKNMHNSSAELYNGSVSFLYLHHLLVQLPTFKCLFLFAENHYLNIIE